MNIPIQSRLLIVTAAVLGFLGVSLGAFGAHALEDRLAETGHAGTWNTAVQYLQWHAVAMLAVGLGVAGGALPASALRAGWIWLAGTALFSGSLFGLSLGGPGWLGPVTPAGGLLFMGGWIWLGAAAWGARE